MPLEDVVIAGGQYRRRELDIGVAGALALGQIIRPERICVGPATVAVIGTVVESAHGGPGTRLNGIGIIYHDIVHTPGNGAAGAGLDVGPLRHPVQVRPPEAGAFVTPGGWWIRVGGQVVHELHDIFVGQGAGSATTQRLTHRPADLRQRGQRLDGVSPINDLAVDEAVGAYQRLLPLIPIDV